jgi:flavodoxin
LEVQVKALILYRSCHGNTRSAVETIEARLKEKGWQAIVRDVRQRLPDLQQIDIVLNGAPTRLKRVNRRSVAVLRKLKSKGLSDKPIAVFDTCAIIPTEPEKFEEAKPWLFPGAAGLLHKAAADLGLNVFKETLRCEVNGMKGPLVEGSRQKAIEFADAFLSSCSTASA